MNTTTTPPADHPEILKKLYGSGRCRAGFAVKSLASATGSSPELAGLAVAGLLGGIAGPDGHILGPADNQISPDVNVIVAGAEDAAWRRLQELILKPVESLQSRLREMGRAVDPVRVAELEHMRESKDATIKLHGIAGQELSKPLPFGPLDNTRGRIALRLSSVLLRSPSPEVFRKGVEEILDRHATIVYPDSRIFAELSRLAPPRQWQELLKLIVDALEGHDERFDRIDANEGFGRLAALKAVLLLTCSEAQAAQAMGSTNPELRRLMQQSLVVRPGYCKPLPRANREYLRGGYSAYTDAVTSVLASRRSGKGMQFKVSDEDYQLLTEYTGYMESLLPTCTTLPQRAWVSDLAWKISWAMMAVKGMAEPGGWCVPYGIHVAHSAICEHTAFCAQEQKKQHALQDESARRLMLNRIERLGPCHWRVLARTLRVQRRELFAPVLEGLVSEGLVVCEDDRYALAAPAKAKEVA